jgi:hypothetical protein
VGLLGDGVDALDLALLAGDDDLRVAVAAVLESQPEPEPPAPIPPAAEAPAAPDIERLRRELEAERALVDRLREAKLKLEQRTTDAEGALAEHRGRRRGSVISRLLNSDRGDG